MSQPTFQLRTVDGETYTQGDTNKPPFGDPDAVLASWKEAEAGGYIELHFSHGLAVAIPERRIDYLAELAA